MSDAKLTADLCRLTAGFNEFDIPGKFIRERIRVIGGRLNDSGGIQAMRGAYYQAKRENPYASIIQAYWDGIGDWRW